MSSATRQQSFPWTAALLASLFCWQKVYGHLNPGRYRVRRIIMPPVSDRGKRLRVLAGCGWAAGQILGFSQWDGWGERVCADVWARSRVWPKFSTADTHRNTGTPSVPGQEASRAPEAHRARAPAPRRTPANQEGGKRPTTRPQAPRRPRMVQRRVPSASARRAGGEPELDPVPRARGALHSLPFPGRSVRKTNEGSPTPPKTEQSLEAPRY